MPDPQIQNLPEKEAIEQIIETVQQADEGAAPFALVLGSGFSHGLVPTARELVGESLPLWMKSLTNVAAFERQKELPPDKRDQIARDFWTRFVERNTRRGLVLPLDTQKGLPELYSDAYRAVFTPEYVGAVGEPAQARKFQRALMRLDKPRLNAAHFLLASLLGVQPGKTRPSELFNAAAAFSRLILTTNFDPFLQTALQAVNRLYFMSDTPELGVGDEIFDDQTDAIHLVYLHGTIHRRSQAATDADIKALKEKNARTLAPALKRHGVIVLGYSGWDDAIVEALAACDRFDYRLYWCGREADPLVKDAFGPRVAEILRKPSALYVQTTGAGHFMAQLVSGLVKGLPRLLDNPIAQLREMLQTIDLGELKNLGAPASTASNTSQLIDIPTNTEAFVTAQEMTLQRLREAEAVFRGKTSLSAETPVAPDGTPQTLAGGDSPEATSPLSDTKRKVQHLISSARVADALANHAESLKLVNEALTVSPLEPVDQADLWLLKGRAHYFTGDLDGAISSWGNIIESPDAPPSQRAEALYSRGVTWGRKGETEKELADYTSVIEQDPPAPVERIAVALRNRGVVWSQREETEKALADYTRVIEQLPNPPVKQLGAVLYNRGVIWTRKGETDKALADYTRLIEQLPGATTGDVATALYNRGVIWNKKAETEKALADYTQLIDHLPGAPAEDVATALYNRAVIWSRRGEEDRELADYTRLIEQLPGASIEDLASALRNRGILWSKKGEADKAIADYTRLSEQLIGAPIDDVATALHNRGKIFQKRGEVEKAMADFTRLIENLPGVSVEQAAVGLARRGWLRYLRKDFSGFLSDTQEALNKLPSFSGAAFNLGLALLASQRDAEALQAYQQAGEQFQSEIDGGLADLEEARKNWLGDQRAQPVIQLLQSLKQ